MSCKRSWSSGSGNLTGTSRKDWLFGSRSDDTINGRGGNDYIFGRGGDDDINGGRGKDKIWAGRGDDDVRGGRGNDKIWAGRGDDDVRGGRGNDKIWAGRGDDDVHGGRGNDKIWAGRGDDDVNGGRGNDRIWGERGDDVLDGGAGCDKVYGGSGNDCGIYDVAQNRGSRDYYHGGSGKDTLVLRMSSAEFASAAVQADLAAFQAFLDGPQGAWWCRGKASFEFSAFDLEVTGWEYVRVELTDPAPSIPAPSLPVNNAPTAVDDGIVASTGVTPIEEVESSDPDAASLFAAAQVIDRAAFRVAPSPDVGDDSLPRISIEGGIEGVQLQANDVDVYAITLQANEKLILDIDYGIGVSGVNTQLYLFDESGNLLASSPFNIGNAEGTGSINHMDPFLAYPTDQGGEAQPGGTYYVAVSALGRNFSESTGEFTGNGFFAGSYVLNVSIDNAAPDLGAIVITQASLLANDTDADNDSLSIMSVGNAVNGSVMLADNGDILFTPSSNHPGSFEYEVSDGQGVSTARVSVNGTVVTGTSGDDVLANTAADELFFGGEGNDTFNFASGCGHDTVADFNLGADALALSGGMAASAMETNGNDTMVSFDSGDSVLLVGVTGVADVNDLFA
ncbi:MAG: cadherin-like domain-containing protein [Gammaproteobacteria bacterium]|nr:cadherin-like domain-containing protein [Gammaproteobacteria bacterium]